MLEQRESRPIYGELGTKLHAAPGEAPSRNSVRAFLGMRKVVSVQIGQDGVEVGGRPREIYCLESGIVPDGER
jgi:hypothetical protein